MKKDFVMLEVPINCDVASSAVGWRWTDIKEEEDVLQRKGDM